MSELVNPNDLEKQEASNGIPSVAADKNNKQKDLNRYISKCLLCFAFVVGLLVLAYALLTARSANASSEVQDPDRKHLRVEDITSTKALTMPAMPPKDEEKEDEDELSLFSESSPKTSAVSLSADNSSTVSVGGNGSSVNGLTPLNGKAGFVEQDEMSLDDLKFAAPMMGQVENSSSQNQQLAAMHDATEAGLKLAQEQQNGGQGPLGERLNAVKTENGTTRKIMHPSLTLNKGSIVECILESRVDTSVPGMVSCIIPRDVYSSNGRVLLIEKGTKAVGEYQGAVQNGLERIFMLWTELRTPESVIVSLNSPAADALGGAGVGGWVDHHWWKRFGNALMFSMVADGFDYAITNAQKSNTNSNVTYNNSEQGVNEIIKAAMEQSGNIPPTLIKNPGERVSIFVARDVDFTNVYELQKQG